MSVSSKLAKITVGSSKEINEITVHRPSELLYVINGIEHTIDSATKLLEENIVSSTVLLLVDKNEKVIKTFETNKHKMALEESKKTGHYVYTADVKFKEGKWYAVKPWIIMWDSVPDPNTPKQSVARFDAERMNDETEHISLKCPYCNKVMTSTSGRTLHINSKHREMVSATK